MHAGLDAPLNVALELERRAAYILFDSDDKREAMRAFLERRKPSFQALDELPDEFPASRQD